MSDLIDRQAAIDAFDGVKVNEENCYEYDIGYNDGIDFAVSKLSVLPSADPGLDEWCTDCKEYDHERHCCPRWNRVIRETLKDVEDNIVRCMDCKWFDPSCPWGTSEPSAYRCLLYGTFHIPEFFCSAGERRTDAEIH